MSAAITASASTLSQADETWTLNVTGASATTAYVVEVTDTTGMIAKLRFTSDGSGAGAVKYTPQAGGSFTAVLRPLAEYQGTTTAAATLSATAVNTFN